MATKRWSVSATWQNVGTAPLLVELGNRLIPARVHIGSAQPTAATDDYHLLEYHEGAMSVQKVEKVWVRSHLKATEVVVS